MNKEKKFIFLGVLIAIGLIWFPGSAFAQAIPANYWKSQSGNLLPVTSSTVVGSSTVNAAFKNVTVSGTCTGCGGGGSSATTTINGVTGPTFTISIVTTSSPSSVTTSTAQLFLNLLANSSSTDITITSTGTIVFASHNISQFTNNSGYITTSTYNANFGSAASHPATDFLSSSTVVNTPSTTVATNNNQLTNGAGFITTSTYNANFGTAASHPATDFLASTTVVNTPSTTIATNVNQLTFGNATSTANISANSFTASSSVNSQIQTLNSIYVIPTNFATAGCFGSSTLTDFGGCVNYAYTLGTASNTAIAVPTISVTQAQWHTPIVFATNQTIPSLYCPGGARLAYGGTGKAVTFNFNVSSAHDVSNDWGCTYLGSSTVIAAGTVNTATTTGIFIGGTTGSNAGNGINFHNNTVNGFGTDLQTASNTYMIAITNNAFSGGNGGQVGQGALLHIQPTSNSGERMVFDSNSFTDPGNSSATNAIYVSDGALNSLFFTKNSFDDANTYIGISNSNVIFDGNHFEDSAPTTYGGYPFVLASSSGATHLTMVNNMFAIDATTAANRPPEGIEEAVNFVFNDNTVQRYGAAAGITNFIDHSINAGQAVETACDDWSQNSAVSNWMQLTGTTYPGCFYEGGNGYPMIWSTGGGSVATLTNGQQTVMSVTSGGATDILSNTLLGANTGTASTTLQVTGASSTIRLGSSALSSHGCIELFDAVNSSTIDYFYASSTALVATTTKPSFCQ